MLIQLNAKALHETDKRSVNTLTNSIKRSSIIRSNLNRYSGASGYYAILNCFAIPAQTGSLTMKTTRSVFGIKNERGEG